ncbi:MAG: NPCBM/NEW2 domain-containing protein [Eubacterium sp.]
MSFDENQDNQMITLKVNGASTPFIKGVCAWAISEMVYDLSEYDYDYFTSYLGIDISEQSTYFNSGARFLIYTSDDCENWELKYTSDTLYGWSESGWPKLDAKREIFET